jgi:alkylation response protein AidB-like acyl-CoA dehydrogenase
MDLLISHLAHATPGTVDSIERLVAEVRELPTRFTSPFDRAVVGGFEADRVAFAFGAGYEAALARLVPSLDPRTIRALCVTETGGGHPQAMTSKLTPRAGGGFTLDAKKRWATFGPLAEELLVVANTGVDAHGRNQLAVVRILARHARVTTMPPTPFAPELPHAEIAIDGLEVRDDDVLSGDGYAAYVKPFRTIEDVHVMGALAGHVAGMARARAWRGGVFEEALGIVAALGALAALDPLAPETHLALARVLELVTGLVTRVSAAFAPEDPARVPWERDRMLIGIAAGARAKRLEAAKKKLGL